jgi:hypothetical protein
VATLPTCRTTGAPKEKGGYEYASYNVRVDNLKRWLGSFTVAPIGVVLLTTLGVAAAIALLGPSVAQAPALVVAVVIALFLLAGGLSGGRGGRTTKSLEDRRAEFGARPRRSTSERVESPAEAEIWQRERERYQSRRETS